MDQYDVDAWVEDNHEIDASALLDEKLPKMSAKLARLDKRIRDVLAEVQTEFPDAQYYTASGGFHLILGSTHCDRAHPQRQRWAWGGSAHIGDGDW